MDYAHFFGSSDGRAYLQLLTNWNCFTHFPRYHSVGIHFILFFSNLTTTLIFPISSVSVMLMRLFITAPHNADGDLIYSVFLSVHVTPNVLKCVHVRFNLPLDSRYSSLFSYLPVLATDRELIRKEILLSSHMGTNSIHKLCSTTYFHSVFCKAGRPLFVFVQLSAIWYGVPLHLFTWLIRIDKIIWDTI